MDTTEPPLLEDCPAPGWGYLAFLAAVFAGAVYFALTRGSLRGDSAELWTALIPFLFLLFLIPNVYSSFKTRYRLFPDRLEMQSGFFRGTLYLREIRDIERVFFIREQKKITLQARNYCSRILNGLKVSTQGKTIYLSPSDPEVFLRRLRQEMLASRET